MRSLVVGLRLGELRDASKAQAGRPAAQWPGCLRHNGEMRSAVSYVHPRDEILQAIQRIYRYRMTTTSGGNLSIRDDNGDVWITPAGIDKGTLRREDIICVHADGTLHIKPHPASGHILKSHWPGALNIRAVRFWYKSLPSASQRKQRGHGLVRICFVACSIGVAPLSQ